MRYFAQILVEIPADSNKEALDMAHKFTKELEKLDSVDRPTLNFVNKQHRFETEEVYDRFK